MTPATRQLIAAFDPQTHEYFAERAAILEESCHVPREEAEQAAFREAMAYMLQCRVRKIAEHEREKPKPLTMPKHAPVVDRKMLASGEIA